MTQRPSIPKPGPNSLSNNILVLLIAFLSELAGIIALACVGLDAARGHLTLAAGNRRTADRRRDLGCVPCA
ncbi:MAG: hypothetical protein U0528_18410 [Anaerolineae bacterium]